MPLMTALISMACSSAYQNHQDACSKFLEASTKSTQVYSYDEKIENYYTVQAKEVASNTLGIGGTDVIGGGAYGYKVYRNKSVDFKLPAPGLADSVSNHVDFNNYSYTLNLTWKMPWK